MRVYYNEFDPKKCAMLKQLMADGHIAKGEIDDRSVRDVQPGDVTGYDRCHFFAGIGLWEYALNLAEWPQDRTVWTGSCPCQPFSTAGRQAGKTDDRHLWPEWFRLIRECSPSAIFGEQVASAVAKGWLDDVYQGLEKENYAVGSAVLPACGIGAPHRRDRLWFVAIDNDTKVRRTKKIPKIYKKSRSKLLGIGPVCFWDEHDIVEYEDGERYATPSKSRIPLLVDGYTGQRSIIHAAGDAIVPQVAAEFIRAAMY